jgi:hypothetical protein
MYDYTSTTNFIQCKERKMKNEKSPTPLQKDCSLFRGDLSRDISHLMRSHRTLNEIKICKYFAKVIVVG